MSSTRPAVTRASSANLALEIAHQPGDDDLVLSLDGDAFTVDDPMPLINAGLAQAPLVAVRARRTWAISSRTRASRHQRRHVAQVRRQALRAASRMLVDTRPVCAAGEFMQELRRRFEPEVREASDYLQRDLVTLWGYDGPSLGRPRADDDIH